MKTSTKFKIAGFCTLAVGATLVILAFTVFGENTGIGTTPNFSFMVPGWFLFGLSVLLLFLGFKPNITKIQAKLHSDSMEHAGDEITKAGMKTVDVVVPVGKKAVKEMSPAISALAKNIKDETTQETVYCKKCGKAIAADSDFCKFCGTKQK